MAKAQNVRTTPSKIIVDEFNTESSRALVILASALLDEALLRLLKTYFIPVPAANDSLFDGPGAPMSNFNSRIDLAYRLGLISEQMCRDLHLVRKIRNDFAHNITGCNFQDQSVQNRLFELRKSFTPCLKDQERRKWLPAGEKSDFQMVTAFITCYLHELAEDTSPLKKCSLEWLYIPRSKRTDKPKEEQKQ